LENSSDNKPVGRPRLFDSPQKLQEAIDSYFEPMIDVYEQKGGVLMKQGEKKVIKENPTITGLAYHLGFESRQSFYDYEEMEEFSYMIKKARLRVEIGYEESLRGNNVAGSIFALKNMGWKDQNQVDMTSKGEQINGFNYVPPTT
jgi:hypothetical protein